MNKNKDEILATIDEMEKLLKEIKKEVPIATERERWGTSLKNQLSFMKIELEMAYQSAATGAFIKLWLDNPIPIEPKLPSVAELAKQKEKQNGKE